MAFPSVICGRHRSVGHCASCAGPKARGDVVELDFGGATVRLCLPCAEELSTRIMSECSKYRAPLDPDYVASGA